MCRLSGNFLHKHGHIETLVRKGNLPETHGDGIAEKCNSACGMWFRSFPFQPVIFTAIMSTLLSLLTPIMDYFASAWL
jgi:hypothetical protein